MAYRVGKCLLRYRLQDKGMTQLDLSIKMGIKVQQINKYVLDKQLMSIQVAKNISDTLGCHIEDLYEWEVTNE